MLHPFVEYLIESDLIPEATGKHLMETTDFIREPIGMIAARHGLLRPNEIDLILDHQRNHHQQHFGEAAVEIGILTPSQVERLLRIQECRMATDIAEALALAGTVPCEESVRYLGAFLVHNRKNAEMATAH